MPIVEPQSFLIARRYEHDIETDGGVTENLSVDGAVWQWEETWYTVDTLTFVLRIEAILTGLITLRINALPNLSHFISGRRE